MSERQTGGPAFPCTEQHGTRLNIDGDQEPLYVRVSGMTLLDYFAGQALAGIAQVANSHGGTGFLEHKDLVAEYAYAMADAMLAARERKGE